MQVICKKCNEDVTMEVDFQEFAPYKVVNNHECEVDQVELKIKALEAGYIL
jgi:hypothetical protein